MKPRMPVITAELNSASRKLTPDSWRHVRIIPLSRRTYQVVSFLCFSPMTEADLAALGLPRQQTTGLTLQQSQGLGQKLETAISEREKRLWQSSRARRR